MKNKKLIKRKDAVAGVIEALLLVALAAIIISTIQLVYIPQMMEQRESDHMDDVENQFSYLKSVIDLQSMVKEDVPISSPITLGSRELPYFVTARAFGQLDIIDIDRTDSKIATDPWMGFPYANIPLTSIKYKAHNSYFVDQTYVLEGGCVIVKQPDGETVKIEPAITKKNERIHQTRKNNNRLLEVTGFVKIRKTTDMRNNENTKLICWNRWKP